MLVIRTQGEERHHSPAGLARPGDLVRLRENQIPEIVCAYSGTDYPQRSSEVARLSKARLAGLQTRATVLRELRAYFAEEEFLEVQPPTRVPAPGLDVHIQAIEAQGDYLITSPEFSMKRLLVGGLERIYSTSPCFRSGESGTYHNVEFTMLEWYRAWAGLDAILRDTEQIVCRSISAVRGRSSALVSGREIDVSPPWRQVTVAEAFAEWVGIELVGDESTDELRDKIHKVGIDVGTASEWDDLFYLAFVERIEPALSELEYAVVVIDWPSPLAALARMNPESPQWALRFEVYVGGIELANAFDELTDVDEQRKRFENARAARARLGFAEYPIDENFLAALAEGLPPSAGIALGVDRLAMVAAGSDDLRTVCAFVENER